MKIYKDQCVWTCFYWSLDIQFVRSWRRPLWPKRPAISCWLILLRVCSQSIRLQSWKAKASLNWLQIGQDPLSLSWSVTKRRCISTWIKSSWSMQLQSWSSIPSLLLKICSWTFLEANTSESWIWAKHINRVRREFKVVCGDKHPQKVFEFGKTVFCWVYSQCLQFFKEQWKASCKQFQELSCTWMICSCQARMRRSIYICILEQVLVHLEEAGLHLIWDKCETMACSVAYLGHVADAQGLQPDSNKVRAINDAP